MKKRKVQAGFSLVEIVVAMAILVIGILGVAPMILFNVKANAAGKNYSLASYLAQQRFEQIRSWPLYEDYSATSRGITVNNTLLFGVENNLKVGEHYVAFKRTTEVMRNGYGTPYDCNHGGGFIFSSSPPSAGYNEGNISGGGSLNTGSTGEICPGGSSYRGEDFKIIRVTIEWDDPLVIAADRSNAHHTIYRYMYLAKF